MWGFNEPELDCFYQTNTTCCSAPEERELNQMNQIEELVQWSESCFSSLAQTWACFIYFLAVLNLSPWAPRISTYEETNGFKKCCCRFWVDEKKKSRFPKAIQRKEFLQAIRSPDQTGCNRIRAVPECYRAQMEMKLKAVGRTGINDLLLPSAGTHNISISPSLSLCRVNLPQWVWTT